MKGIGRIEVGETVPVVLQIPLGTTGLFPQAEIRDDVGTLLTTLDLSHEASGLYVPGSPYAMPAEIFIKITYIVYTDAPHTIESAVDLRSVDIWVQVDPTNYMADLTDVALEASVQDVIVQTDNLPGDPASQSGLESYLDAIESNIIGTLQTDLGTMEASIIGTIQSDLGDLEANIIAQSQLDLADLETNIMDALDTQTDDINSNTDNTVDNAVTDIIAQVQADLGDQTNDIDLMFTIHEATVLIEIDENQSLIEDMQLSVDDIQTDVTAIDGKVDTISTNVDAIELLAIDIEKLTGNRVTRVGDIITIYENDGSTPWRQYDLSAGGRLEV